MKHSPVELGSSRLRSSEAPRIESGIGMDGEVHAHSTDKQTRDHSNPTAQPDFAASRSGIGKHFCVNDENP